MKKSLLAVLALVANGDQPILATVDGTNLTFGAVCDRSRSGVLHSREALCHVNLAGCLRSSRRSTLHVCSAPLSKPFSDDTENPGNPT